MKSANQLYKESNSDMPFKEWLQSQQQIGVLKNHDKMYNANGSASSTTTTTKSAKKKMGMLNIVGLVSLGILLYGLSRASATE